MKHGIVNSKSQRCMWCWSTSVLARIWSGGVGEQLCRSVPPPPHFSTEFLSCAGLQRSHCGDACLDRPELALRYKGDYC